MKKLLFLLALVYAPSIYAQNSGALLPALPPSFLNASGVVNAGGFLCTTASGTNTNQATYSDAALMSALPNPITLNSAGIPTTGGGASTAVYLSATAYRITLYAPGTGNSCNGMQVGSQIWQRDHVYDFGLLSSNGLCPCNLGGVIYANTTSSIASSSALFWNDPAQQLTVLHTVNQGGDYVAWFKNTSTTSGDGYGVLITAGATTSDITLQVASASLTPFLTVLGNGTVQIPTLTTQRLMMVDATCACITSAHGTAGDVGYTQTLGTLTVSNKTANEVMQLANTNATSGQNFGLEINAGTNSSDFALKVTSSTDATTKYLYVDGVGGVYIRGHGLVLGNSATDHGAGAIDASSYYAAGTPGLNTTATVRNSAGSGTCQMTFTIGILTASTC